MQPTSEKKKKILRIKNILEHGKIGEREKFSLAQKVLSFITAGGELSSRKSTRERERKHVTRALIIRNINHEHYNWDSDEPPIDMLLHFLLTENIFSIFLPVAPAPHRNRISTRAFAHVNVLYAFLHVRFNLTVYTLSLASWCSFEHPSLATLSRARLRNEERQISPLIKNENWRRNV